MARSIGNQRHRRYQRWTVPLDASAALGFAALSALACCGWLVIQWLSLALYAVGGAAAFRVLIRYEAPILLALGGVELVAARLTRGRIGRLVNVALGALAIALGALRLLWEFRRSSVLRAYPLCCVRAPVADSASGPGPSRCAAGSGPARHPAAVRDQ